MTEIWIWQRIISPHMSELAVSLARHGMAVTYVVEREMSQARQKLGWVAPELPGVRLLKAASTRGIRDHLDQAGKRSVHICQGIRGNGYVRHVQAQLTKRGLQQWAVMETVDDEGFVGVVKRLVYSAVLRMKRASLTGLLATGADTPDWVVARGFPSERVFPFAYFLRERELLHQDDSLALGGDGAEFRIAFIGQFISLKSFPVLIEALASLLQRPFELVVVGAGPLEGEWRSLAESRLPFRVKWLGRLSSSSIPTVLKNVDCLVLPSRYDGWGAVVSEALIVGTPAICSSRCGAAGIVRASGFGGVFPAGDASMLANLISAEMDRGRVSEEARIRLSEWARCLGSDAGAKYLISILNYQQVGGLRPTVPWLQSLRRGDTEMS